MKGGEKLGKPKINKKIKSAILEYYIRKGGENAKRNNKNRQNRKSKNNQEKSFF